MYNSIEEYVQAYGYQVSDLTPEELKTAQKEMEDINNGIEVLDGLFSAPLAKDLLKAD